MGKKILLILFTFFLLTTGGRKVYAQTAGSSAALLQEQKLRRKNNIFIKRLAIESVFAKYNSPLANQSQAFISTCIKYSLDCYLLPAIASIESGFGKRYIKSNNNPFGWGGGYIKFESLDKAIDTVGKTLREKYINRGAKTIPQIGRIYAADPNWAKKVIRAKRLFEKEERKQKLLFYSNVIY